MNEILTGRTARAITFDLVHPVTKIVTATERRPAGTEVHARLRKNDTFDIRVAGTLLTQNVYASAIDIP